MINRLDFMYVLTGVLKPGIEAPVVRYAPINVKPAGREAGHRAGF